MDVQLDWALAQEAGTQPESQTRYFLRPIRLVIPALRCLARKRGANRDRRVIRHTHTLGTAREAGSSLQALPETWRACVAGSRAHR